MAKQPEAGGIEVRSVVIFKDRDDKRTPLELLAVEGRNPDPDDLIVVICNGYDIDDMAYVTTPRREALLLSEKDRNA